jgi:hypothetical protein
MPRIQGRQDERQHRDGQTQLFFVILPGSISSTTILIPIIQVQILEPLPCRSPESWRQSGGEGEYWEAE